MVVSLDAIVFTQFLSTISQLIEKSVFTGLEKLADPLLMTLGFLGAISIMTNWELYFSERFNFGNIIVKLMHIGMMAFFIRNWHNFLTMIKKSAETIGLIAGGQDAMLEMGAFINKYTKIIYDSMSNIWNAYSITSDSAMLLFISFIVLVGTLLAFFKIAYEVFCINNEFFIIGGLSIILLPFSVTKWTESITQKTWGILVSLCIRLVVITFFYSVIGSTIESTFSQFNTIGDANVSEQFRNALPNLILNAVTIWFLAYLMKHSSEMAASMVQGAVFKGQNNLVESAAGYAERGFFYGAGKAAGKVARPLPRP